MTLCQKMQILVSRAPRVGVRGAVPVLPSQKCCSGLRQEMWRVVKVGHSSDVETRANPPAPPSFPALTQGGWWLGETFFRCAEAQRGGGAVALEAGFVFQVFAFVSRRSGLLLLLHTPQLGSCQSTCAVWAVQWDVTSIPSCQPSWPGVRPWGLLPGCPTPALMLLQYLTWNSFPFPFGS